MYNEDFVNIIVWIVNHFVAILKLTTAPQVETTLYHLPRPTKHHIDCLDNLLANLEHDYGLDQEQVGNQALSKIIWSQDGIYKSVGYHLSHNWHFPSFTNVIRCKRDVLSQQAFIQLFRLVFLDAWLDPFA